MRVVAVAGLVLAAGLVAAGFSPAQGASDAVGNLGSGGTARGDISTAAGESDTISVDLQAGSRVNFRWTSGFQASVRLFGPAGAEVATTLSGKRSATMNAWPVPSTGHYEFHVAASDATQGFYTLQVRPYWDRTVVLDGSGTQTLDVAMPAAGRIKGKVQPLPGASNPSILSLMSPSGSELLVGPVVGTPGLAKLKPTDCPDAGVYQLTAQAAAGTQAFRATLKRAAPRIPLTTANLVNGLSQISYATGGVKAYFDRSCAGCHSWAGSYVGVRAYASLSLARMSSGNMPAGGPRASPATLSLVKLWMTTGYGK